MEKLRHKIRIDAKRDCCQFESDLPYFNYIMKRGVVNAFRVFEFF